MHIWVAGAGGMLGSELSEQLRERGWSFAASDREVNICDPEQVDAFVLSEKVTHIINCAAYTQVDLAEKEPEVAYAINADGPKYLAKASERHGCRLIHISTDYVFDGTSDVPYTENSQCHPINVYGKSKLLGEKNIQEFTDNFCIVRTSWLIGRHGANFIKAITRKITQEDLLRVVYDQTGRATFCRDLAEAILDVLLDYQGIIHFANQGALSWHDLAKAVHRELVNRGTPLKVREIRAIPSSEYPMPAKRPAYSVLDTAKYERLTNKSIRHYQKALEEYLDEATACV